LPKTGRRQWQNDRQWTVTRVVVADSGRILVPRRHWKMEGSIGVVPKGMERSLGPEHGRHAAIWAKHDRHCQLWDAKNKIREKFGAE
jgi:hypothetical protein